MGDTSVSEHVHVHVLIVQLKEIDLMVYLCCVESLSDSDLNFSSYSHFKNEPKSEKYPRLYSPWFFPKNGSEITPKFLLHFLIHIDVFMLCSKFELIPTSIFQVTAILKNEPKS